MCATTHCLFAQAEHYQWIITFTPSPDTALESFSARLSRGYSERCIWHQIYGSANTNSHGRGKRVTELSAAGRLGTIRVSSACPIWTGQQVLSFRLYPHRNLGLMPPDFSRVNRYPILSWNIFIFKCWVQKTGRECHGSQTKCICYKQ